MLTAALFLTAMIQEKWTPTKLYELLKSGATLDSALEPGLVAWFGGEDRLKSGTSPMVDDGPAAVWAIRVPEGTKSVFVQSDDFSLESLSDQQREKYPYGHRGRMLVSQLRQVGTSRLFVGGTALSDGDGFAFHYVFDDKPTGDRQVVEYHTMPKESHEQPGVPKGKLEQQPRLTSQVFGGTWHDWWIYTPANFDPTKESNLVVFQDGQWAHNYAPVYFDNLIAQGELPQTMAVFITPGTFPDNKSDRSREYDTLSNAYSRFLLEEVLPLVEAKGKLTQDPMKRCVAGLSSGGICSFTVAWERPDKFGLVMSWIGSFTNIASGDSKREGGHNYPALVRKVDKKPIRVFLQDGENDLDNGHGNWWLSNQQMAKALEFKGYELKTVWGGGGHTDMQGRATMADALRWLFKKP